MGCFSGLGLLHDIGSGFYMEFNVFICEMLQLLHEFYLSLHQITYLY